MSSDKYTNYYEYYKKNLREGEVSPSLIARTGKPLLIVALLSGGYFAYDKYGDSMKHTLASSNVLNDLFKSKESTASTTEASVTTTKVKHEKIVLDVTDTTAHKEKLAQEKQAKLEQAKIEAAKAQQAKMHALQEQKEAARKRKIARQEALAQAHARAIAKEKEKLKQEAMATTISESQLEKKRKIAKAIQAIRAEKIKKSKVRDATEILAPSSAKVKVHSIPSTPEESTAIAEDIHKQNESTTNRITLESIRKKMNAQRTTIAEPKKDKTIKKIVSTDANVNVTTSYTIQSIAPHDQEVHTPTKHVTTVKPHTEDKNAKYIIVREGDTLGTLAKRAYGSAKFYKKLYKANRNKLSGPNDLQVGKKLRIN